MKGRPVYINDVEIVEEDELGRGRESFEGLDEIDV